MPTIVKPVCLATLVLALAACSKLGLGQDEMSWARDALQRNDRLQVVTSDNQAKTFTVRMKDSGQLVVIPVDQIVAGPAAGLQPPQQSAAAPAPAPAESPAAPAKALSTPASESPPPPVAPATPAPVAPSESAESPALASNEPVPHAQSAANARPGSVLASGPGYSIKASGSKAGPASPSPAIAPPGAPERLHDPIICQGARLLHIDNRNLEFDGDAITAEDGCEIHITNTHISAKGIGVLARAANVHIKNSEIDGESGAVDASDGAQVYAESSRFRGLTRRLESSAFHDLGGNVWN